MPSVKSFAPLAMLIVPGADGWQEVEVTVGDREHSRSVRLGDLRRGVAKEVSHGRVQPTRAESACIDRGRAGDSDVVGRKKYLSGAEVHPIQNVDAACAREVEPAAGAVAVVVVSTRYRLRSSAWWHRTR